jgi:hypothetical protein
MTTMTENLNEIDSLDTAFWDDYTAATAPAAKTIPTDGRYTVRMPDSIPDSAFEVKAGADGKRYLQVTLDPLTIVSDDEAVNGYTIRFARASTRPIPNFVKDGEAWKAAGTLNASDAADLLLNFGSDARPVGVEDWKQAIKALAGRETPTPVYFAWGGYDKTATGKAKYLRSKDFPTLGDGTRPNFIERTNEATGATYRVWANLQVGRRGFAPRS